MGTIGTLNPTRNGGWIGLVFVMAHRVRITLAPNDNRAKANAPAFRVFSGSVELGAFWGRQTKDVRPRQYLSGELDFPGLCEPLALAVFFSDDRQSAQVVWNRQKRGGTGERPDDGRVHDASGGSPHVVERARVSRD